jgi:phosphatidylinositol alpha-1,6-mannosyltransferase
MARQLSNIGENIVVVAQGAKQDKEVDRNNKFITYRCINLFILRELALFLLLPYIVLKHKINVIYLLYWCQGGIATYFTSKLLDRPYIIHAYGEEFVDCKRNVFDRLKYGLFRRNYKRLIFKSARKIIAISNYTKNIVIESGADPSCVEVVYCGVDVNRFKPGLKVDGIASKYNLGNRDVLLTVSRLKLYKGHDIVIKLIPELLKKHPNLLYIIVGSGDAMEQLESLVNKMNLKDYVIFAGEINSDELPLYYNACDLYIMLTKERKDNDEFEGFGLVFLEANSCGKPVIGARTGGIVDAIRNNETGFLVDPDNSQEIASKISLLLEDKGLANKMGENGRNRILSERLLWEHMADRARNIIYKISR